MNIINIEVKEDLNPEKKLLIMASIPEEDPNPIIRMTMAGEIIYSNASGKALSQYWKKAQAILPSEIIHKMKKLPHKNAILYEESSIDSIHYLLSISWSESCQQINIYGTDITKFKINQQDFIQLARNDGLTQIANRKYFEEKLTEALQINSLNNRRIGLVMIDLDNFKMVNDSLGHLTGDRLLQFATKRMLRCLRKGDFIARLGGDEFIVIINNATVETASVIAENINQALVKPFEFGGYHVEISCSIGIALSPETAIVPMELLKHADIAMYEAKKAGKNRAFVFSNAVHRLAYQRDLIIKKDLKYAMSKNEFFLEYQPQFDLKNDQILGFEALLRWQHPDKGIILPNEFIPLAEQSGLINNIGQWIIEQAISDYSSTLFPHFQGNLSINISLPQLTDGRFIDTLTDSLYKNHLSKDNLILDLSDHILNTHLEALPKCLDALHAQGIKLSLDNFGSPNIPFTTLLDIPLNYIKFDKNLIENIANPKQQAVLQGMIAITAKLGMQVIQKGVERREQAEILKSFGCPYAQGKYFCKPLRLPNLLKFLSK